MIPTIMGVTILKGVWCFFPAKKGTWYLVPGIVGIDTGVRVPTSVDIGCCFFCLPLCPVVMIDDTHYYGCDKLQYCSL